MVTMRCNIRIKMNVLINKVAGYLLNWLARHKETEAIKAISTMAAATCATVNHSRLGLACKIHGHWVKESSITER